MCLFYILGNAVAFLAHGNGGSFADNIRIPFENIIHSTGSGYDPARSVFICPVNGVYFFSISSHPSSSFISASLRLDEVHLFSIRADVDDDGNGMSNSGAVLCNAGQIVDVVSTRSNSNIAGGSTCVFTGALIQLM
jgi:hypothetical protein